VDKFNQNSVFSFCNNSLSQRLKNWQPLKQEKTPSGVLSIDYPIGIDNPKKEKGNRKKEIKAEYFDHHTQVFGESSIRHINDKALKNVMILEKFP
jgi:hypothetical protein